MARAESGLWEAGRAYSDDQRLRQPCCLFLTMAAFVVSVHGRSMEIQQTNLLEQKHSKRTADAPQRPRQTERRRDGHGKNDAPLSPKCPNCR